MGFFKGLTHFLGKKLSGDTSSVSSVLGLLLGRIAPDLFASNRLRAYKGWVHACVNAIAEEVASVELKLQQKKGGKWEDVEDHPAIQLLRKANPIQSGTELIFATQAYKELDGNSFWYVVWNLAHTKPVELWPLDPTSVTVETDDDGLISKYKVRSKKGRDIELDPDEIIHHKTFNPHKPYRGMGTVEAAALAIDTDEYAAQWNRNFFANSAMPSATLETDKLLTQEQLERIKAEWKAKYEGVDNAHRTAVLQAGLKFNPINPNQRDMQFLEQRRYGRDEILGIFRVTKSLLGIVEDVNRANAEASEYIFARYVVRPKVKAIVEKLNEFYLPLFDLDPAQHRLAFVDPVPRNVELELKRKETGLKNSYYTINEVRAEEGLPPVPGGDEIYLPLNLLPMSASTDEEESKTVKKGILTKAKRPSAKRRNRFIKDEVQKRRVQFQKILDDMKADLIKRLRRKKSIKSESGELVRFLFEDWNDWVGVVVGPVDDALKTSLAFAGKEVLRDLGVAIAFDLKNPRVIDWLKKNALKHAKSVTGTVKDEIAKRVVDGVDQGLGADALADSISEFFDKQGRWRALRIARSEVISGYGQGSLEGARQSKVAEIKKWVASGKDPCELCIENASQGWLEMEEVFSSGDKTPGVHPNCECHLEWQRKKEE